MSSKEKKTKSTYVRGALGLKSQNKTCRITHSLEVYAFPHYILSCFFGSIISVIINQKGRTKYGEAVPLASVFLTQIYPSFQLEYFICSLPT